MVFTLNWVPYDGEYLAHHGIQGQKWGVRRFQNPDGTLTSAGKEHYSKNVFVSGSSKTQDKNSEYYRRKLPKSVKKELDAYRKNGGKVLVGDAPGIDRQVQDYLHKKRYKNVEVYGPGKQVRYSADKKWKTNPIDDPDHEPMSKEWLAKKDIAMTNASDQGLAVVLDEGAKATRKNVERLIGQNKDVSVYELSKYGKKEDHELDSPPTKKEMNALRKEMRSLIKKVNSFDKKAVNAWKRDEYPKEFSNDYMWKVECAISDVGGLYYDALRKYGKQTAMELFPVSMMDVMY